MIRPGVWAAVLAALICTGCGSSASQAGEHFRVPMLLTAGGTPHIVGGTATMRSGARAILGRMGRTSVVEVRFGAAPSEFGQFRGPPAPDRITTTVAVTRDPLHSGVWAELAGLPALWEASVFEHAYLAGTHPGEPRIRGTSEALATPAGHRDFTAEPASRPSHPGPAPSRRGVRTALAATATRGRGSPAATRGSGSSWGSCARTFRASSGRSSIAAAPPSRSTLPGAGRTPAGCARPSPSWAPRRAPPGAAAWPARCRVAS